MCPRVCVPLAVFRRASGEFLHGHGSVFDGPKRRRRRKGRGGRRRTDTRASAPPSRESRIFARSWPGVQQTHCGGRAVSGRLEAAQGCGCHRVSSPGRVNFSRGRLECTECAPLRWPRAFCGSRGDSDDQNRLASPCPLACPPLVWPAGGGRGGGGEVGCLNSWPANGPST
jgi:hypothetical protein